MPVSVRPLLLSYPLLMEKQIVEQIGAGDCSAGQCIQQLAILWKRAWLGSGPFCRRVVGGKRRRTLAQRRITAVRAPFRLLGGRARCRQVLSWPTGRDRKPGTSPAAC